MRGSIERQGNGPAQARLPELSLVVVHKRSGSMPQGTIKKLVADKGFGFIQTEDGNDVFFHHSSVADRQFDNLTEGQRVEYTLDNAGGPKGKGPRAATVTLS